MADAEEKEQPGAPASGGESSGTCAADGDDDEYRMETAPFDPRFPNQNQTKHCYVSFLDYHRCIKLRGEDYEPCQYFKRVFTSLCPHSWVAKWNDQLDAGTFAGKI